MADQNTTRRRVLKGLGAGAASAGFVGASTAHQAPDRHIVGVSGDTGLGAARAQADAVHRELDFGDVGKAVAGRFPEPAIEQLRARADVRYVEEDGVMHALHHQPGHGGGPPGDGDDGGDTSQTLPWGIDRTDADVAHNNGETGNGVDLAIIDTGIDDDHPDLQANVGAGEAFVSCSGSNCNQTWSDDNDHGTHCAGIANAVNNSQGVVGVSTEATLHAVKVLDSNGGGTFSDVASGIEFVANQGWDIASLSLGGSQSSAVADAVEFAASEGVFIVAAAGNSGPCTDCVGFPAAEPEAVAVSSTDSDDTLSSFSSTGSEVEIAAPGGSVCSSVIGGYATFSGTSMATPHVAGAAAQLMANGATASDARSTLTNSAEDLGLSSNEQGAGLLDVAAALGLDSSDDGTGSGSCP